MNRRTSIPVKIRTSTVPPDKQAASVPIRVADKAIECPYKGSMKPQMLQMPLLLAATM